MARKSEDGLLVVVSYNPTASAKDNENQRSSALSHAARVAHERRRRKSPLKQPLTRKHHGALVRKQSHSPTPSHYSIDSSVRVNVSPVLYSDLGCIQHGNSDPFASLAVPADPEAAYQISEWKSHLVSNSLTATLPLTEGELKIDLSFDDELHGRAILFVCAAFLSLRYPNHAGQYMRLSQTKSACLQQLDSAVSLHTNTHVSATFLRILSVVFLALVLSGITDEARRYARKLQLLLLAGAVKTSEEEIAIFCRMHYYDFQASLIHFQPPVLESSVTHQAWHHYMLPVQQWTRRRLPPPSAVRSPTFSLALQDYFSRLQQHIDVQCEGLLMLPYETSMNLLPSTTIEATGLLETLFAYRDSCQQMYTTTPEPAGQYEWHTESVLVTAALAFLACATYGPEVVGLKQRAHKAMHALRHELEHTPAYMLPRGGFDEYGQARLWSLYIGSLWEYDCRVGSPDSWFLPRLRHLMDERGVASWPQLRNVVDRFLSVPPTHIPGMVWFLGMARDVQSTGDDGNSSGARSFADTVFLREGRTHHEL